jgi:hypothetical protein
MRPEQKLKAVRDLIKSRGWAVLHEVMQDEILASAMAIADSPNMDLAEINFRRGSIWAAKQMLEMPTRLQAKLESEIALSNVDDKKKTSSDTSAINN